MRTILLSLVVLGLFCEFGNAAEARNESLPWPHLARDAVPAAEALHRSGTQIPRNYAIRRSILHLSDRIARTAREWPADPESGFRETHRQKCRERARRLLEDSENLLEATRSYRNSAEAARDMNSAREARRMITTAWSLRVTVRRLQREVEGQEPARTVSRHAW